MIEPRTVETTALAVRRSNYSARSHPSTARSHPAESYPATTAFHWSPSSSMGLLVCVTSYSHCAAPMPAISDIARPRAQHDFSLAWLEAA